MPEFIVDRKRRATIIQKAFDDGLHIRGAAKRLGISPDATREWAWRLGIKIPGNRTSEDEVERRKTIIQGAIEEGLTLAETAKRLGVSRDTAHLWAKRLGIKFPGNSIDGEDRARKAALIREAFSKGLTTSEVAKRLGISCGTAIAWAHRLGINIPKNRLPSEERNRRVDILRKAAKDGLSVSETAKRIGVSYNSTYNLARSLGIKLLPKSLAKRESGVDGIRRCPRCGMDKPAGEFFFISKKGNAYRVTYCKSCRRAYTRSRYRPAKTLAARLRQIIVSVKSRSRKMGLPMNLTYGDLIDLWKRQKGLCYYTEIRMTLRTSREATTMSIDRIDSSKGYTKDNCVFCCLAVNYMKRDYTFDEFKNWCRLVVDKPRRETMVS